MCILLHRSIPRIEISRHFLSIVFAAFLRNLQNSIFKNVGIKLCQQFRFFFEQILMKCCLNSMELRRDSIFWEPRYLKLGDFAKAHELSLRGLDLAERRYPEDHPHVVTARMGLGYSYTELGDFAKAAELHERALASTERA